MKGYHLLNSKKVNLTAQKAVWFFFPPPPTPSYFNSTWCLAWLLRRCECRELVVVMGKEKIPARHLLLCVRVSVYLQGLCPEMQQKTPTFHCHLFCTRV